MVVGNPQGIAPMNRAWNTLLGSVLAGLLLASSVAAMPLAPAATARPAPAFTHTDAKAWVNSPPLSWDQLRGQVVLIDFWTFACWNCYRSFPWLNTLYSQYQPQGLQVIGVHTPELPHERVRATLLKKIEQYALHHPIMVDDDHSYWNAIGNRYWPAFYLFDKQGRLRAAYAGETHAGDPQARRIEADVRSLLAEDV